MNKTGIKHGGRKKGTPNRLTRELRDVLKDVVYQENLNKLDPKNRIDLLIKVIPFVCPKIKSENHDLNEPSDTSFLSLLAMDFLVLKLFDETLINEEKFRNPFPSN